MPIVDCGGETKDDGGPESGPKAESFPVALIALFSDRHGRHMTLTHGRLEVVSHIRETVIGHGRDPPLKQRLVRHPERLNLLYETTFTLLLVARSVPQMDSPWYRGFCQ